MRELTRLQAERGYLNDETLRQLAREQTVPLYRLEGLVSFYPAFRRTPPLRVTVDVCRDICCAMAGSESCGGMLSEKIAGSDDVQIRYVSCLGRCDAAPAVAINERPLAPITLNDQSEVLAAIEGNDSSPIASPLPTWKCDPYVNAAERFGTVRELAKGRSTLAKICIERLSDTGLRGMGGAGFPTGRKWELVAKETSDTKYVICNADESEPGTFKDREILRTLPHLVVEGMVLAGLTIGAERGIVYLRHEYHPEQQALERAIEEARVAGVLGQEFDIEIFVSPGGYILGEETALLEALEDKRGEPRNKPPYPGTHGLWGKPTLINNVETFALATSIIHHGAEWWREQGCDGFAGLKFISVSGDVENPGVFEIPLGTTVREVVEMAGGMKDGVSLKAFLPGGASSNFLAAEHIDTPMDFDAMQKVGSMLGTGAVIVIGEGHDLFALATNLVQFFRNESCGKCVPCRLGSDHAVDLLQGVQSGELPAKELDVLTELGATLQQTSICGLGQVALNPVLSMMQHFPEEIPV